ncbi:MAG: glycosyltransferase family 39 protein [Planctomycetes bacterium]|nr:glycosyltransferase family 39 protein [Planctomycetota bacterium]
MNTKILVAILVAGSFLRGYLVVTAAGTNNDAYKYIRTAEMMSQKGLMAGMKGDYFWPYYPVNRQLPMYPFLGSLLNVAVGNMMLSLRLISAIAGIALIWLTYAIARELFERDDIALLSAALVAFHPEFTRASAAVYREVLMAALIAFSLLLVLWAIKKPHARVLCPALAGLSLFAAFMTRPEGVAAALAGGLTVLLLRKNLAWKKRIVICGIMTLFFFALEVPYIWWLKRETGRWMVTQWQVQNKMTRHEAATRFLLNEREDDGIH